jgi:hypothetical protein
MTSTNNDFAELYNELTRLATKSNIVYSYHTQLKLIDICMNKLLESSWYDDLLSSARDLLTACIKAFIAAKCVIDEDLLIRLSDKTYVNSVLLDYCSKSFSSVYSDDYSKMLILNVLEDFKHSYQYVMPVDTKEMLTSLVVIFSLLKINIKDLL